MSSDLQTGIFFSLLAGVIWGIGPLLLKHGMALASVSTATLIEQYSSVLTLVVIIAVKGEWLAWTISAKAFWAFVAAGVVGASFGKIFYYKGIDKIGASKATSVKNSSPILTTILAVTFLGEELSLPIAAGVVLIVLGIMVLTRMEGKGSERQGPLRFFLYPMIAAVCYGINPVFKKIGVDAAGAPALGSLITQLTGLIVMLTAGRFLKIKPKWEKIPLRSFVYFTLAGITEASGSLFTFYALIYAPAVLVSPLWRISPLVTFLLAHFTLRGIEVVTPRDGLAAAFIVGGIFVLSHG